MSSLTIILLAISLLANFLLLTYLGQEDRTPNAFRFLKYFVAVQIVHLVLSRMNCLFINEAFVFSSLILHFAMMTCLLVFGIRLQHKHISWARMTGMLSTIAGAAVLLSLISVFMIGGTLLPNIVMKGCLMTGYACAAFACFKEAKEKRSLGFYALTVAFALSTLICFLETTPLKGTLAAFSDAYLSLLITVALVILIENVLSEHIYLLETSGTKDTETLTNIILTAPSPIILSRLKDDKILLMNEQAKEMFGLPEDVKENKLKLTDYYAEPESKQELLEKLDTGKVVENHEVLMRAATGKAKDFWALQSARLVDYGGEIVIFSLFQDITSRKIKEIELFDQATKDPLTKTYNRRQFEEIGLKEFARSKRSKKSFCLLMLDADHFKNINDTYGHATGDEVLKELAECCHINVRESDTVARLGGEEFVILLPETPKNTAVKVAEKLRKKISELRIAAPNGKTVKFTVSIGVSSSDDFDQFGTILEAADEAMYKAKTSGRNRVVTSDAARKLEEPSQIA